ncbi:MAG: N-formylglutamate amidohydrolase [Candidatus Binatia bacterium]|nr:N-formylglutamate amidohydrolase [Candidatus Binatia bacterium]MDG2011788.1 N-formylglutamate amidohydrolase [Candidatus Binatia bacterium]HAC80389.1 N-formylglutamate amidohydrolase [Deltaproteobacteria bacterium]
MKQDTTKIRHWVLTCEHASKRIPRGYRSLGLAREQIADHIGWDIGAREVQKVLARDLPASAIYSSVSRLLVDPNRHPGESSLIPAESDQVLIPGNQRLTPVERRLRLSRWHAPYHARIDASLGQACRKFPGGVRLLSIHSFTPVMDGHARNFDIGVLFDAHVPLARAFGRALKRLGLRVRYNEPYSGYDGLIYAAKRHGEAHQVPYVELEINNALIREDRGVRRIAALLRKALLEI